MVRTPSYDKSGLKKGTWTPEEDRKLIAYVTRYGCWNWRQLPRFAGLARCGKSCRLRWMNYLRPNIKRGNYTPQEEDLIIKLHKEMGNRWSAIAAHLPGRTDNEIKNHWHTTLKKRSQHTSSTLSHNKSKMSKDHTSTSKPHCDSSSTSSQLSASSSHIEILDSGPLSPQSYSSSCLTSSANSSLQDDLFFLDALTKPETQNLFAHLNLDDMFYDDPTETIMPVPPPPHPAGLEDDFAFLDSPSPGPLETFLMETQMADISCPPTLQPHASFDELEYPYPLYGMDLWSQST